MAAQRGKDLLLKIDTDGLGTFAAIAGLRARSISFNARSVDITNMDSPGGWRELLAGAGVKTAAISGAGIFRDEAADETVRGYFFNGTIRDWQIVIPDFGTLAGPFQIVELQWAGQHDAEVTYNLALESAGQISFAAL